jgi:hypothetical protein
VISQIVCQVGENGLKQPIRSGSSVDLHWKVP